MLITFPSILFFFLRGDLLDSKKCESVNFDELTRRNKLRCIERILARLGRYKRGFRNRRRWVHFLLAKEQEEEEKKTLSSAATCYIVKNRVSLRAATALRGLRTGAPTTLWMSVARQLWAETVRCFYFSSCFSSVRPLIIFSQNISNTCPSLPWQFGMGW